MFFFFFLFFLPTVTSTAVLPYYHFSSLRLPTHLPLALDSLHICISTCPSTHLTPSFHSLATKFTPSPPASLPPCHPFFRCHPVAFTFPLSLILCLLAFLGACLALPFSLSISLPPTLYPLPPRTPFTCLPFLLPSPPPAPPCPFTLCPLLPRPTLLPAPLPFSFCPLPAP